MEQEAIMKERNRFVSGLITGILAVVIAVFLIGWMGGSVFSPKAGNKVNFETGVGEENDIQHLQQKIGEIDSLVNEYYIFDEPSEERSFEDLYLSAYVDRLGDPYTVYMSQDEYIDFSQDSDGRYAGIGLSVTADIDSNRIMVVTAFDGFPAAEVGVLAGDQILTINDEEYFYDNISKAIEVMKGDPGTTVDVSFYRESTNEVLDFVIERKIIDIPTVSYTLYDDVAHIIISRFADVTIDQFRNALEEAKNEGAKALVVDVRNNPGGQLTAVKDVASQLMDQGNKIMFMVDKQGGKEEVISKGPGTDLPMVLLVNEWSASASEVLAGGIKDRKSVV